MRLAIWFHRAVHEPGATAREDAEASAQLAEEVLPTYGVSPARTAEVARLVRLTGGVEDTKGANAEAFLDAVNAVLADQTYPNHAAEVRRDADRDPEGRSTNAPFATTKRRYDEVRAILKSPIYRTQIGRDRFEADARANLTAELATLDALLPAPWRGWQRAALVVTAVLTPLLAFAAAFSATQLPWRVPKYSGDSVWPAVVLTVLSLAAAPALYWSSRQSTRAARIVPGVAMLTGVAGVIGVWINVPQTNEASGVGQRVPLLVISSVLLVVAGAASVLSVRTVRAPRNRGQVLAGLGAAAVIVLATIFVIDPLQRAYLLSMNEHLDGQPAPASQNVRSELTGEVAWTSTFSRYGAGGLDKLVATRHGLAVSGGSGTVEMLDPATGTMRWRYTRTDSDDEFPSFSVLNGGESLLVSFDDLGYVLLDAGTGRREAAWPGRTRDDDIENSDPLVTGRTVSKGSDKLYGTNLDGTHRWKFEPGNCITISAEATADAVLAQLGRSCGESDEMVALNLSDGKKLWTRPGRLSDATPISGLIVGVEGGTLTGLEPRSGDTKWRWTMPTTSTCPPKVETADNLVVLISCSGKDGAQAVVTAIDAESGRVSWTATAPVPYGQRYAVTSDGRVVFVRQDSGDCRLVSVGEHKSMLLDKSVRCGLGIAAAGDLLLVAGDRSIIALR